MNYEPANTLTLGDDRHGGLYFFCEMTQRVERGSYLVNLSFNCVLRVINSSDKNCRHLTDDVINFICSKFSWQLLV